MCFDKLYTIVWDDTVQMVPALDDGPDGMLFLTLESAQAEAERQTDLYGDGRVMRAEPVFVQ